MRETIKNGTIATAISPTSPKNPEVPWGPGGASMWPMGPNSYMFYGFNILYVSFQKNEKACKSYASGAPQGAQNLMNNVFHKVLQDLKIPKVRHPWISHCIPNDLLV